MSTLPRANYPIRVLPPGETEVLREQVAHLDYEMVISTSPDMAVVRVFKGARESVYIGTTAERALRIGEAFIRAALRLDPALRLAPTEKPKLSTTGDAE